MAYFDQAQFDVRCEWGLAGVQHLAPAKAIVIVDVLSFTTCVDVALNRGAVVLPYRWKDDSAIEYARQQGAELAGPRGRAESGYSLAPASLMQAQPGLRLVLPSPNGSTLALAAKSRGALVVAACLRNASAVAGWVSRLSGAVTVVPAGERWADGTLRPAVEDLIAAGAVIRVLPGRRSPEAALAVAAFERFADHLTDVLLQCTSGRELAERGFSRDVELAAELDVSQIVPVLEDEAFVAAPAAGAHGPA